MPDLRTRLASTGAYSRRAFLGAALATPLAASVLAACGAGTTAASTGSVSVSVATTAKSAASSAAPATSSAKAATTSANGTAAKPTPTLNPALLPTQATPLAGSGGPHLVIWWPNGSHNYALDEVWKAFQQTHQSWSAEISYTNGYDKFLAAVAAGTGPDIPMPASAQLLAFSYKGILKALDDYISRDKVDMSQYFPAAVQGSKYKSKTYGMPQHLDVGSVYQNDRLLQEVGLDPSKGPSSWDDLANLNSHLVKKSGTDLQRVGYDPTWGWPADPTTYFQANGVPLVSEDLSQVAFDGPGGLEALTWVQTQIKQLGGLQTLQAYQKLSKHGAGDALAHDTLGAEQAGIWDIPYTILKAAPNLAVSQWSMPGGPSAKGKEFNYYIAEFNSIWPGSKVADSAWEFIKFSASEQGQVFIQTAPGAWDLACLPAAANNAESIKAQPWRKRANELMAKAVSPGYWPVPGSADVAKAVGKPWDDLLAGKIDPQTALTQMKQAAQVVMDQYKS